MKVEEAKGKMCPYAVITYFMPGNMRDEIADSSCCQANHCMAWRWHYEAIPESEKSSEITAEFLFARTLGVPEMRMSKTNGYCGLAGKDGAE